MSQTKINLNTEQKNGFIKIVNAIKKGKKTSIIKGFAGCGKTYLTAHLVNYLTKTYKVCIVTPTHKALEVINDQYNNIDINEPDNLDIKTVHSLLGLKGTITNTGKIEYKPSKLEPCEIQKYDIIVVDECSMIQKRLLKNSSYAGLLNHLNDGKICHIVFVGDPCQLLPVNETHSSAFEISHDETVFLTEIVRQAKDNPIIGTSLLVRANIKMPINLKMKNNLTPGKNGVVWCNMKILPKLISKLFVTEDFKNNSNHAKIIAWRNVTVNAFNKAIRKFIFGNVDKYVIGDFVFVNETFEWTEFNQRTRKNENFILRNSTELTVVDVELINHYYDGVDFNFPGWNLTLKDKKGISYRVKVVDRESEQFNLVYNYYHNTAEKYTKQFPNTMKAQQAWIDFYKFTQFWLNLSYNYAITVHKAQGSTYNNTVVIYDDLTYNRDTEEKNRLIYTAITRAKDKLLFFTKTI